jgi:hypothetical protein
MPTPPYPGRPLRRSLRWFVFAGCLGWGAERLAAAPAPWAPVDPAQLAETAPKLDADASAEVLFWKLRIDDRDYPESRTVHEYVRYKIFDPEKAVNITRISLASASVDGQEYQGEVEIRARLILPDGTIKEFGDESVHDRPLARTGTDQSWVQRLIGAESAEVNEKFLAVSGIQAGSLLEFQLSHTEHSVFASGGAARYVLQRDIPIRQLELTHLICHDDADYFFRSFALNRGHAESRSDPKTHMLVLTAHDLPALVREPFSGAIADYALTYLCAYRAQNTYLPTQHISDQSIRVDTKSGPWAGYATKMYILENDMAVPDSRIRDLAAQLTAGAPSALEKAERIHKFVQDLRIRFLQTPRKRFLVLNPNQLVHSIDQVLDFDQNPDLQIFPEDFQCLALTLYRAAGLQAQGVLLPNRAVSRFDPRMVAEMFLQDQGVRVLIDGQWQFSYPIAPARMPFGLLPWRFEGQVALVVQSNKQEFVEVPLTPADQSVIANTGNFRLDARGNLTGDCQRTYTGQSALQIRVRLRRANEARAQGIVRRLLAEEFKPALIRVTALTGVDDPSVPLTVAYQMHYRDFAVLTADRIIFRPSVFHAGSSSPFSSATRQYAVEFPYPWKESDDVSLQLPAGYQLETKNAPPSYPGDVLSYLCDMTYQAGKGKLHLQREFISKLIGVPTPNYGRLKAWYDNVAANDQHEMVLLRLPGTPAPAAEPADATAPPGTEEAPADSGATGGPAL